MAKEKFDQDYKRSLQAYNFLPTAGKGIFDKALLGRIVGRKTLNKAERQVAKNIPHTLKGRTYPVEQALTNPVVAGIISGVAAAGMAYFKPKMMKQVLKSYMKNKSARDLVGKALVKSERKILLDPDKVHLMSTPKRIEQVYGSSPSELKNKFFTAGVVGAASTAVARQLHARALMGEIIQEHRAIHKKDPSEYIRSKLRGDPSLKSHIKTSEERTMDKTAVKIISVLAPILIEKLAYPVPPAVAKELAETAGKTKAGLMNSLKSLTPKQKMMAAGAGAATLATGMAIGGHDKQAELNELLKEAADLLEKLSDKESFKKMIEAKKKKEGGDKDDDKDDKKGKKDEKEEKKESKDKDDKDDKDEKEKKAAKMSKEEFVAKFVDTKKKNKKKK